MGYTGDWDGTDILARYVLWDGTCVKSVRKGKPRSMLSCYDTEFFIGPCVDSWRHNG